MSMSKAGREALADGLNAALLEAIIQQLRNELDHAWFNNHHLAPESQGVAPGEKVAAIRSSSVLDAIEGAYRRLGLPIPEWIAEQQAEIKTFKTWAELEAVDD